jgi:hypothetical protein
MDHAGKVAAGVVLMAVVVGLKLTAGNLLSERRAEARKAQGVPGLNTPLIDPQARADELWARSQRESALRSSLNRQVLGGPCASEVLDNHPPPRIDPPSTPRTRTQPGPPPSDPAGPVATPDREGTAPRHDEPAEPRVTPTTTEPEPVVYPGEQLELEHSPRPLESQLAGYEPWELTDTYERFLGETHRVGAFTLRATTEFAFEGQNARGASWGATAGKRGVGLEMQIDRLYPRDAQLRSPVLEDFADYQEFRIGRRTVRAAGEAEVRYRDSHGLLIWRIALPANEGSQLATCHYVAIVEGQMVVLTARYDKDKPGQLVAFDTIAGTLVYDPQ